MNIIVCIKQVPDISQIKEVSIDEKTNTLRRENMASIVNPFDMYAIEEAIRIKERVGGTTYVISMGPLQAMEAIREAISMGIDEGIIISDNKFSGSDTLATARTLAKAISRLEYDLILCGKQAADGDTAQVGPEIATLLDIPVITFVRKIEEIKDNYIKVERLIEGGYEKVEAKLPALLTVVKEINEPRLPTLRGKLIAKKKELPIWDNSILNLEENSIGLNGSPTRVVRIFKPERKSNCEKIFLEPEEAVKKIIEFIKKV